MILNCDWLQLFCDLKDFRMCPEYTYERLTASSNVFSELLEIYQGRRKLAMIAMKPYSPIIDKHSGLVKIINSCLYAEDCSEVVSQLLSRHHIRPKSLSRVDIAGDFVSLPGYPDPEKLIRDILMEKVVRVGRGKGQASGKQGRRRAEHEPFAAIWNHDVDKGLSYEYLRFGKRSSNVAVYMYDKTVEMQEVTRKPYIVDKWRRNGLVEGDRHVWRLEFSLKPAELELVVNGFDHLLYDWHSYLFEHTLAMIYYSVADKYFRLVDPTTATRITRCKPLKIILPTTPIGELSEKTTDSHSDRSMRVFLGKLSKVNDELRTEQQSVRMMSQYLVKHYAADTDLQEWASQRGINLTEVPTEQDIINALADVVDRRK